MLTFYQIDYHGFMISFSMAHFLHSHFAGAQVFFIVISSIRDQLQYWCSRYNDSHIPLHNHYWEFYLSCILHINSQPCTCNTTVITCKQTLTTPIIDIDGLRMQLLNFRTSDYCFCQRKIKIKRVNVYRAKIQSACIHT